MIAAMIAIIIGRILGLAGPYTLQYLIDAVFQQSDMQMLNRITLALITIFAAQSVFYFIRAYQLGYLGERVMADLRISLFEYPQGLSLRFFNERRTGELVSRLTNDVSTVRGQAVQAPGYLAVGVFLHQISYSGNNNIPGCVRGSVAGAI